tara:strand:- start:554 stop:841 length:288 start_codon:yes stop_codon:yes gene_type:complete
MSDNVTTTREDVNVTVTESLNDSIFKSLTRIESSLNEVLLMMEHLPRDDSANISEAWEKQLRSAVITALRRHRNDPDSQIIIDTVVAIMKGHNED